MKKRSKWMQGLLEGEDFIRSSGVSTAQFYLDTELGDDPEDFRLGWFDVVQHYKRLEAAGYVHPNQR